MDQQPANQQPGGGLPQDSWQILFKIAKRIWLPPILWIIAFFIQVEVIKNTGLKDIPHVGRYFEVVLGIEALIMFAVVKKLMPKDLR